MRSKIILILLLTGLVCLATGGVIGYRVGKPLRYSSLSFDYSARF
jgi:hypothetical protein